MKPMESIQKKLSIRLLLFLLLGIAFLSILGSAKNVKVARSCIQKQQEIEKNRRLCEAESRALMDASDYLTSEVWRFIATGEAEYMDNYWDEVNTRQSREKSLIELESLQLTPEESQLVYTAKEQSDYLVGKEAWAMRLIADSLGMDPSTLPPQVAAVKLDSSLQQMDAFQKMELANSYIFGDDYRKVKENITGSLADFRATLSQRISDELSASLETAHKAIRAAQLHTIFVLTLLVASILLFYQLVLFPFRRYSISMKNIGRCAKNPLVPSGSKEMRAFGQNFNEIFNKLQEQNVKLKEINGRDILTNLPNRAALNRYLQKEISLGKGTLGILMLDVDSLRTFNDLYGHVTGDQILIKLSAVLSNSIPGEQGMVSRLGGEEFLIVLPDTSPDKVDAAAGRILSGVQRLNAEHHIIPQVNTHLTVSIGSILWDRSVSRTPKDLIQKADLALCQAKKNGKNQHMMFFENDYQFIMLENNHIHDSEIEAEMYEALDRGEFIPYFQPQYNLHTGALAGAEALIRWNHPEKGLLYPDYFIPLFERNGFIEKTDLYIFETVCRLLRSWLDNGKPVVPIACNFSRVHLGKGGLAHKLKALADRYQIPPALLEIEITESALMENSEFHMEQIRNLRAAGFPVAIDDFGVGYSSLGLIQDLSADILKIDKSFLQRDMADKKNVMILQGVISIAKTLNLKTLCEGVETGEQEALLKQLGCEMSQGYYYSRPEEVAKLEALLATEIHSDAVHAESSF